MTLKNIIRLNILFIFSTILVSFLNIEFVEIPLIAGFLFQIVSLFLLKNVLFDFEKRVFLILGAMVLLSIVLPLLLASNNYPGSSFLDKLGNSIAEALFFVGIISLCTIIFEIYYWICLYRHNMK